MTAQRVSYPLIFFTANRVANMTVLRTDIAAAQHALDVAIGTYGPGGPIGFEWQVEGTVR